MERMVCIADCWRTTGGEKGIGPAKGDVVTVCKRSKVGRRNVVKLAEYPHGWYSEEHFVPFVDPLDEALDRLEESMDEAVTETVPEELEPA